MRSDPHFGPSRLAWQLILILFLSLILILRRSLRGALRLAVRCTLRLWAVCTLALHLTRRCALTLQLLLVLLVKLAPWLNLLRLGSRRWSLTVDISFGFLRAFKLRLASQL